MILTREQAILEHRIMWNEMAAQIEKTRKRVHILSWKKEYMKSKKYHCQNNCFLCEYSNALNPNTCNYCPLDINNNLLCLDGLYDACVHAITWEEQAKFARKIANLPERKV